VTAERERLLAVGVDGAPRGWVAACCFGENADVSAISRRTEPRFFSSIEALADWRDKQPGGQHAPVGIDIPIGLPETVFFRPCDRHAREILGERRSSVFHPPGRYLLAAAKLIGGKPPTAQQLFAHVQSLVAARRTRRQLQHPARRIRRRCSG
jgi:predicted RNase H-like nuclease